MAKRRAALSAAPVRPWATAASVLLVAVLLAVALPSPSYAQPQQQQADPAAAPRPAPAAAPAASSSSSSSSCPGGAPPRILISSVVPVATPTTPASITLRNAGGSEADLSQAVLVDAAGAESPFAASMDDCDEAKLKIAPGSSRTFTAKSEANPCGFSPSLALGADGSLAIKGSAAAPKASWANAPAGAQLALLPDGKTYQAFPGATADVIGVLRAAGSYRTLLAALEATGIAKDLAAPSDPAYVAPDPEAEAAEEAATGALAFPAWFSDATNAAAAATAPARPPKMGEEGGPVPPVGVPAAGPFTIFAPDDDAFNALLTTLGGNTGRRLPREALLRRPELRSILEYHVVPGLYATSAMRNNTPLWTARGVEMVSFAGDPCAGGVPTAGRIGLTDTCIDKPTPDAFTCAQQRDYDKCDFPFMSSALAAQWTYGFCTRACGRCSCDPSEGGAACAEVALGDLIASNGVVHGVTRVLLPPPKFTKQAALEQAAAYNATIAAGSAAAAAGGALASDPAGALVLPGDAAAAPVPAAAAAPVADPAALPPAAPQPALLVGRRLRRRV
jgi:hypothetical protein